MLSDLETIRGSLEEILERTLLMPGTRSDVHDALDRVMDAEDLLRKELDRPSGDPRWLRSALALAASAAVGVGAFGANIAAGEVSQGLDFRSPIVKAQAAADSVAELTAEAEQVEEEPEVDPVPAQAREAALEVQTKLVIDGGDLRFLPTLRTAPPDTPLVYTPRKPVTWLGPTRYLVDVNLSIEGWDFHLVLECDTDQANQASFTDAERTEAAVLSYMAPRLLDRPLILSEEGGLSEVAGDGSGERQGDPDGP